MSASLTVGTAGHVDHGKTALVRALTGVDTDRLPEERRRGISIKLGYAPLPLGSGASVSIVDVPGHERFVSTMVAGASGIDVALIVVACDDGVMPQTREHVAICALLGIERAVVALSKRDLVEEIEAELARAEVEELLEGTPFAHAEIVECSISNRDSVERLRDAIERSAADLDQRVHEGPTRLAVDRAFILRGIGCIVTGTLWSGSVGVGDQLALAPGGPRARVRSVEVHDRSVERAEAGRRVSASLVGVERGEARSGQMLIEPGSYPESFRLDVRLDALSDGPGLAQGTLVRVLHGTADIAARVRLLEGSEIAPGARGLAQLRLQERAVAARGDRLIVRQSTPATTLAGGVVLDPSPRRHAGGALMVKYLEALEEGSPLSLVASALATAQAPRSLDQLTPTGLLGREQVRAALSELERTGSVIALGDDAWIDGDVYRTLHDHVARQLARRAAADPLDPMLPIAAILPMPEGRAALVERLAADGALIREGSLSRAPGARALATEVHENAARAVLMALVESGRTPPDLTSLESASDLPPRDFQALVTALERDGEIIRLGVDRVHLRAPFTAAQQWVELHCREAGAVTVAELRDELGTSRRIAQAILEHLDGMGVTRRVGDKRVLRRKRTVG
ncbi:MAG TPA: selenocysteine-specific translation elongation factor [Microbacteriaceae bacterium]|jgi:selenocysteine-specific elongation factor|nr:selenocysteine-specific translation elongation factor [Microbacteriaceae bacterium]